MVRSCSSQISSLVALHLGKSPVSAKELPRGLEIFHMVSRPHGSSAILPVAVTLGCCREGEVVISSSVLLQGALDNTARWIFTRVFLKLKLLKKPPGKCSIYPISWSHREEGGRSKPQMWDQISVLTGERPASFTECVFQITHPNWKEGVRDKFQKYFTYYPPVKDKETKVLTKILQGKEPNFLSPRLDFPDHHGPWWAGLSCPRMLQVAKAERPELQSEDILATFNVQTATILQAVFAWGYPTYLPLFAFWAFPWKSESPCGDTGRRWLSHNMPATCQVSK